MSVKSASVAKRSIAGLLLAAAIIAGTLYLTRLILWTRGSCAATGENPLQLTLTLAKPEANVGKNYSLWYRLSLKNTGCDSLFIDSRAFLERSGESGLYPGSLKFRVWGPDGKEVSANPSTTPPGPREFGPMSPYKLDRAANQPLVDKLAREHRLDAESLTNRDLPHFEGEAELAARDEHVSLFPQETIQTTPSILSPSFPDRLPGFDLVDEENTEAGQALARQAHLFYEKEWKAMGSPMPTSPPAGFRPFDEFDRFGIFNSPGRYKVQAIFDEDVESGYIFPAYDRLDRKWQRRLHELDRVFHLHLSPPRKEPAIGHVHAESEVLEFEVKR